MYHQQQQPQQQSQHRAYSPHPPQPRAWPGHHPYHDAHGSHHAPSVHPPPPPHPVHYPSLHPHRQHYPAHPHYHAGHHHYRTTTPYHYPSQQHAGHGSTAAHSPAAAGPTSISTLHTAISSSTAPALVSPSAHQAVHGAMTSTSSSVSPVTPQTVPSSSPVESGQHQHRSPVVAAAPQRSRSRPTTQRTTVPPVVPPSTPVASPTPSISTAAASATAQAVAAAAANNIVTSKPPRPYTEYTMFYQLEREFILHRVLTTDEERGSSLANSNNNPNRLVATTNNNNGSTTAAALFQNDPLMPARYRTLPLRADWYISGKSKKPTKRKHRKSHGKIGFLELTRLIASRWAQVDIETRKYCKMMAAMELVKYKEDMESYNLYKERLSVIGEIPEDMKERMVKKQRALDKKKEMAEKKAGLLVVSGGGGGAKKKKADRSASSSADSVAAALLPALHCPIKAEPVGSISSSAFATAPIKLRAMPALPMPKLEPIAHNSPIIQQTNDSSNLDNDMEQFISSLVSSPTKPSRKTMGPVAVATARSTTSATAVAKTVVTPERSNKKRRLFREKPAGLGTRAGTDSSSGVPPLAASASQRAAEELMIPLKDGDGVCNLDGIQMNFSGIDENEIAREFPVGGGGAAVSTTISTTRRTLVKNEQQAPQMSFDYGIDYWDALVETDL